MRTERAHALGEPQPLRLYQGENVRRVPLPTPTFVALGSVTLLIHQRQTLLSATGPETCYGASCAARR